MRYAGVIFVFLVFWLSSFCSTAKVSGSGEDFSFIDSMAIHAPLEVGHDTGSVAAYLLKFCKTDIEKARAAYTWEANNIRYDDNAYNTGRQPVLQPNAILRSRRSVCEGYSNLYKAICEAMGLEALRIDGYAKAYGYHAGEKFDGDPPNHSWNAVKIDGNWILVDVTWGAGHAEGGRGKLVSRKDFTPYWFNVNKYEFLYKHYPIDPQWQLIPQPVSLKQYEDEMPHVQDPIFMLGFDAKDMLEKALSKTLPKQLPEVFTTTHNVKVVDFPLNGVLAAGTDATFSIKSDEDLQIAISNDLKKPPVMMSKTGNTYTATLPLKRGDLHIAIKNKGGYSDILLYKVK